MRRRNAKSDEHINQQREKTIVKNIRLKRTHRNFIPSRDDWNHFATWIRTNEQGVCSYKKVKSDKILKPFSIFVFTWKSISLIALAFADAFPNTHSATHGCRLNEINSTAFDYTITVYKTMEYKSKCGLKCNAPFKKFDEWHILAQATVLESSRPLPLPFEEWI